MTIRPAARSIVAALLMLPLSAGGAQAARDSTMVIILGTLRSGNTLRVSLLRERWAGRYLGYSGDTLFLGATSGPPMAIRFNAVDTLWSGKRAWRRGARNGAITLGIVGGLFVGAFAYEMGANGGFLYGMVAGGAAGGVTGGLFGAMIGAGLRQWQQLYPP